MTKISTLRVIFARLCLCVKEVFMMSLFKRIGSILNGITNNIFPKKEENFSNLNIGPVQESFLPTLPPTSKLDSDATPTVLSEKAAKVYPVEQQDSGISIKFSSMAELKKFESRIGVFEFPPGVVSCLRTIVPAKHGERETYTAHVDLTKVENKDHKEMVMNGVNKVLNGMAEMYTAPTLPPTTPSSSEGMESRRPD